MKKETWKLILLKVKAYFLALAANLWEDCIKEYFKNEIHNLVIQASQALVAYRHSQAYEDKKLELIGKLFDGIKLPLLLRPFKGIIKAIALNVIDKKIDEKLGLLESKVGL